MDFPEDAIRGRLATPQTGRSFPHNTHRDLELPLAEFRAVVPADLLASRTDEAGATALNSVARHIPLSSWPLEPLLLVIRKNIMYMPRQDAVLVGLPE